MKLNSLKTQMKRLSLFLVLLLIAGFIYGQKFPIPVKPGDTLVLKTVKGNYNFPTKTDTFWILKNSQLQNAISKARKLDLSEQEVLELKRKNSILKEVGIEKDSLVSVVKKDRDFYQEKWKVCETDFGVVARKAKRRRLFTRLAIIAIPVAFVAGYYIAK